LFPFPILFTFRVASQNFITFESNKLRNFRNSKLNLGKFHQVYHSLESNASLKSKNHLNK